MLAKHFLILSSISTILVQNGDCKSTPPEISFVCGAKTEPGSIKFAEYYVFANLKELQTTNESDVINPENYWTEVNFEFCCSCCPHFWFDRRMENYYCVKRPGHPRYALKSRDERTGSFNIAMKGVYKGQSCCDFNDADEFQPRKRKSGKGAHYYVSSSVMKASTISSSASISEHQPLPRSSTASTISSLFKLKTVHKPLTILSSLTSSVFNSQNTKHQPLSRSSTVSRGSTISWSSSESSMLANPYKHTSKDQPLSTDSGFSSWLKSNTDSGGSTTSLSSKSSVLENAHAHAHAHASKHQPLSQSPMVSGRRGSYDSVPDLQRSPSFDSNIYYMK